MTFSVPERLAAAVSAPEQVAWLRRLPAAVRELERRWSLTLGAPLSSEEATAAWLAPAERADGTRAILKLGLPHMEAAHEIDGLRFWAGDPAVRLLEADDDANALLATDLHAGNVLHAQREPWLVIDPKPFVGDPAYDATQHLLNCLGRLRADPEATVRRSAELLGVDRERVRLWLFARVAAEPGAPWDDESMSLARALAP